MRGTSSGIPSLAYTAYTTDQKTNISALRTRECIGSRVDNHPANRSSFCLVE